MTQVLVFVRYNGDCRFEVQRPGMLPGISQVCEVGDEIEFSDQLLADFQREPGTNLEFAEFVAGIYNANLPCDPPKWEVIQRDAADAPEAPEAPSQPGTESPSDPGTSSTPDPGNVDPQPDPPLAVDPPPLDQDSSAAEPPQGEN